MGNRIKAIYNHKKAVGITLTAFLLLTALLSPLLPRTVPPVQAATTPGKLILLQTVDTEGSYAGGNLHLTLDEVGLGINSVSLPLTADNGSADNKKVPRDTAKYAAAFYDTNGTRLIPILLGGRWSDTVNHQSGNIGIWPTYFNLGKSANNKGHWIVDSEFSAQMPASTRANVEYGLKKSASSTETEKDDEKNNSWGEKGLATKTYPASGSTMSQYASSIRSAYQRILADYLTDYWAEYTFELPAEITAELHKGKDVYVLGYSEWMCRDNVIVELITDKTTREYTHISIRTRLNPNMGQTTQTVSSAVFGGNGGNYVPYNNYWMHFAAFQGNKYIGRTSYVDPEPPAVQTADNLSAVPTRGSGTFGVLTNGALKTYTGTLGNTAGNSGSAFLYSDNTQIHTDYMAGLFYFLADYSADTDLSLILTADPKEREVAGSPGSPATLGEDVTVTVDLNQTPKSLTEWTKRLTRVQNVDVYLKVTAPDGRPLTCETDAGFSNPNGQKVPLTKEQFLELLKKKLTFTDKVSTQTINPGQVIRYDYSAELVVEFRENGTGDIVRVTAASPQDTDYASFFRVKDPPPLEYVKYVSSPSAYSELKQGTIGNEAFEAMAGVPTTRSLYFATGGSEFIVDFEGVLRKEQTAKRTYQVHYNGIACEFKDPDDAKTHALGGVTVNAHTGGGYTAAQTWSGSHSHTQNPTSCGTCGAGGFNACTLNTSAYNTALAAAATLAAEINGTVLTWTAGSDKQTRTHSGWGASPATTANDTSSTATAPSGGYGCLHGGCSVVGTEDDPHDHSGGNCSSGSPCGSSHAWAIEVRFSVSAHVICGPCCSHNLPAVDDTWTQEIEYDYLDFTKAIVWRLEQGRLTGMGTITGGTGTLNAETLQGTPTLFYNIADTETSRDGRFRYSLEPRQHDTVVWNKGARSDQCDKQDEDWGTGIRYTNAGYPHQTGYLQDNASEKDQATPEYAEFLRNRETPVTATVISDFLILQTSSGDQSVVYYDKKSNTVQSEQDYDPVPLTKTEVWDGNPNSASRWSPEQINIGSYNGKYADPAGKYNGSGSGSRVATVFDSDPAGTVTRPARPSVPLHVAKYGIGIQRTLPNGQYETGLASAVWINRLNYNPDAMPTPFGIPAYSKNAPYSDQHSKINDIVVHNPVSAEYAMLLSLDSARDQRTASDRMRGSVLNNILADAFRCPGDPEGCEFRALDCHYQGTAYHTVNCYTAAQEKANNAHYHSVGCVDAAKMQEAVKKVGGTTTLNYTGGVQTFTAPVTGQYTLETWGAQGGNNSAGGLGGYAKGTHTLTAGQTVYVYVGGQGSSGTGVNGVIQGGWNGGGQATNAYFDGNNGSGGGATDIRVGGTALSNRIIVAGGGGGGVIAMEQRGHGGGSSGMAGVFNSYITGTGGTQSFGGSGNWGNGSLGQGGSSPRAGGGGGYYGGGAYSEGMNGGAAGGGGSGYIGGVSNGSMQTGVRSGSGRAVISWESNAYAGDAWGLVGLSEIVRADGGYTVTTEWLARQPYGAPIFQCGGSPLNIHICNASCNHTSVLICNEPHHVGGHYELGSANSYACWDACRNDNNHRPKNAGAAGSVAAGHTAGGFVNLDWGFQIYYPNTGDFWQGGALGIPSLTAQRGKGFVDGMDTTEWVKSKRVRFGYDVLYCGPATRLNVNGAQHGGAQDGSDNHKHTAGCTFYRAGDWIELSVSNELYNFYVPAAVRETISAEIGFESVAINAPGGENDNALPANRLRDAELRAKHGALKMAYTDVVGRLGNLVLSDTGDYRFSNLFKNPLIPTEWYIENIVRKVDLTSKNWVLAEDSDIRGLRVKSPYGQDTYGTSSWLRNNMLSFSLSPDKNNLDVFRKEPIRAGYPLYMSVDTVGRGVKSVVIQPHFYWFDTATGQVTPLDVYMEGNRPVNLFGQPEADSFHPLALQWDSEYARRNVSEAEYARTKTLGGVYPLGNYHSLGTAQLLTLDERTRTFVGSASTLGIAQNSGGLASREFELSVKRWHFTLGVPSSAFVVDVGADPSSDAARRKYKDGSGAILLTADIFSISEEGFTLEHDLPGGGSFSIGDKVYSLPPDVPNVIAVLDGKFTSKDDVTIRKTH